MKDPAFLFYYQDFIVGTLTMDFESRGAYITILAHMADRGGELSEEEILELVPENLYAKIRKKFLKNSRKNTIYHHRLKEEIKKRQAHSRKQSKNAKMRWHKSGIATAMPLEDEDENTNESKSKSKSKRKNKTEVGLPWEDPGFSQAWDAWNQFRAENKWKKYSPTGERAALSGLKRKAGGDMLTACQIILNSIENSWQGLFELKPNQLKNGKNRNYTQEDIDRYFDKKHRPGDQ